MSLKSALYSADPYGRRPKHVYAPSTQPAPSSEAYQQTAVYDPGRYVKKPSVPLAPKPAAASARIWNAVPTTPTGGTGTGGYVPYAPPPSPGGGEVTWSEFGYDVENAPAQWKALKPSSLDERSEWLATMNMLIPFLSPENQATVGQMLAQVDPEHFGHLSGMAAGAPGIEQAQNIQERFGGRRKLMQAMEALSRFRGATGTKEEEMGTGYRYLTDLIGRISDFSGVGAPQSRLDYTRMMGQLEPMLEMAPTEYKGIAQMMLQPSFAGGVPMGTKMGNQWAWGTPHRELWG